MTTAVLAAEYTNGSKTRPAILTINRIVNGAREFVTAIPVAGKREARRQAAWFDAKPWNF